MSPYLKRHQHLTPDAGLYLNPPQAAVVLDVDHKSQIQALDRAAPVLLVLPGTPARRSHDDTRHGTTNLGTPP